MLGIMYITYIEHGNKYIIIVTSLMDAVMDGVEQW